MLCLRKCGELSIKNYKVMPFEGVLVQQLIYGSNLSSEIITKLREEGITLRLEKQGSFTLYQREGGFPEGPLKKVVVTSKEGNFFVYPVHSIHPEISTNLMLRLSRSIIIAPCSTTTIYVKVPISAGVYVFEGETQMLIDFFSRYQYKYALYGSTSNGIICRFYRTDVYLQVPDEELWSATTKVIIENSSDNFCEVKNIVLPFLNTMIYIDERGVAYAGTVRLQISRDGFGVVSLDGVPPFDGLKECPQKFGRSQERSARFLMEFGL